jgi:hypothetical protein
MGLADKLKKAASNAGLWEGEETVDSAPTPPTRPPYTTIPAAQLANTNSGTISVGQIADPETVRVLSEASLQTKNTAFADFKKLFDALQGLPDPQRYPAALNAAAATSKISAQDVLAALMERDALLKTESDNFDAAMGQANEQTVSAVIKQVEQVATTIDTKKKEIDGLIQQQIALSKQIQDAQATIATERASFAASFAVVKQQIDNERKSFQTYITSK